MEHEDHGGGDRRSREVGPTFLIVGAAKAGTTSLWNYLAQHPEVYLSPRKHTRFFSYGEGWGKRFAFAGPPLESESVPYAVPDLESYHRLFAGAKDESARGEASHSYLYSSAAARRIYEYDPSIKIIAILRQPAERAFSHHRQMIRDGREDIQDFVLALQAEPQRIAENWWPDFHYVQIGLYYKQLKRYFDLFGGERIKVLLYDDFAADARSVLTEIHAFLGVRDVAPRSLPKFNASGLPRSAVLHRTLQNLRRAKPHARRLFGDRVYQRLLVLGSGLHNRNLTKNTLSASDRRLVTRRYFRDDLQRLAGLIDRDLSHWTE